MKLLSFRRPNGVPVGADDTVEVEITGIGVLRNPITQQD
jgi:2-keto-4-pentenoate hydratase/2-oxohepta-3-ene-1,7-dioic acid hydratase in catechol pathway